MNNLLTANKLIKTALIVAGLSLSFGATAGSKTDSNYLAECKTQIKAQYGSVNKIDIASISSKRNLFKAKLRVKADGERSLVLCEIRGEQPIALNCLKGNVCETNSIAAN